MLNALLILVVVLVGVALWKLAGALTEVGCLTDEWKDEPWTG